MLTTLFVQGYDLVLDEMFELGLRSLLDGLALRFESPVGVSARVSGPADGAGPDTLLR